MQKEQLRQELKRLANPEKARLLAGFFKTGPGEYAEGDRFYGVTVPQVRAVAKKYSGAPLDGAQEFLRSPVHEERLLALLILIRGFAEGDERTRKEIFDFYLRNTRRINNWDLVDLSAPRIVGGFLKDRRKDVLLKLSRSGDLWERRIAIVSTLAFIVDGDPAWTFRIAAMLIDDEHDLIHKATGWMLREAGKRCSLQAEEAFLKRHLSRMPRTMLRYAIERFPEADRKRLMRK